MKKLTDIFAKNKRTFSFELFPPKTEQGYQKLLTTLEELKRLHPDFISCTYGAGGGNRDRTFDIVQLIQDKYKIAGVAHLTCVVHDRDHIKKILEDIKARGIPNVLALRGDTPLDMPHWQPGPENFKYSSELVAFIRKYFNDFFSIGVAGFPEGHLLCPDRERDAQYLKLKIDSGADFVITQLFFDNADYFSYVARLKKLGVSQRIIPGILLITDYNNLEKFCASNGARLPQPVKDIFEPIRDNKEKTLAEGINFTVRQCQELLNRGAPGLHFYILNKSHPIDVILRKLRE
jgi:methylenetetrahydrofolate reductase (NADPH)